MSDFDFTYNDDPENPYTSRITLRTNRITPMTRPT